MNIKIDCRLEMHKTVVDCLASVESIVTPSVVPPSDLANNIGCLFAMIKHSIIRLRRRTHNDWPIFSPAIEEHVGDICRHFNTRWLISVVDTYADYGSAVERGNALCISVIGSWEKLALTERTMSDEGENAKPAPEKLAEMQRPLPLWDGMTTMIMTSGANMLPNMFRRINASMCQTPVLQRILLTILQRIESDPSSTLSRINTFHERDLFADIYRTFSSD
jgi:hypothetical protein